jgi:6-phosphofructokinase 1
MSKEEAAAMLDAQERKAKAGDKEEKQRAKERIKAIESGRINHTLDLAHQLEALTGLESRITILGHLQRGGTPSATDRLLATRLGSACADYIHEGRFGVMVAARGEGTEAVPLEQVAGRRKPIPLDHPLVETARSVGTNLGD